STIPCQPGKPGRAAAEVAAARMPRIPIFRLGQAPAQPDPPQLASYKPSLSLEGLQVGVDNLRQDVYLSQRVVDTARSQIAHLIVRYGEVEGLLAAEGAIVPQQKRFASRPSVPNNMSQ